METKLIFDSKIWDEALLAVTPDSSEATSAGVSGDDMSDSSSTLPSSCINAENYITVKEGCQSAFTVPELSEAVERCRDLVLESEECTEERKWLVRRLIELRHRLQQAKESEEDNKTKQKDDGELRVLLGHHFKLEYQPTSTRKKHCDRCSSTIWNVVQSWYQCVDCQYKSHINCLEETKRVCAHLIVSESPRFEARICPEVGLAAQAYRCFECYARITYTFPKGYFIFGNPFSTGSGLMEARLCDYTGRYYCPLCHWNTTTVIPARVVHNWDFTPRLVSRAAFQLIKHARARPLLTLDSRLYGFIEELALVKKMREELIPMKQYIATCRFAMESGLVMRELTWRQHLVHSTDIFSLNDLIEINNGTLLPKVQLVHSMLLNHIKVECKVCQGRGYICEHCDSKEVIFPFDDCTYTCDKCGNVQHKICWTRKQVCPKCVRREKKRDQLL